MLFGFTVFIDSRVKTMLHSFLLLLWVLSFSPIKSSININTQIILGVALKFIDDFRVYLVVIKSCYSLLLYSLLHFLLISLIKVITFSDLLTIS